MNANGRQSRTDAPWVFHRDGQRIKNFRKAWASACQEAGVPAVVAMMITGHKTRSVFDRYNIVSSGDFQEAARRIDQGVIAALKSLTKPFGQEQLSEALPS